MSLTMSTLSQMVEGFTHVYETEMKPWSGREKPRLSGIYSKKLKYIDIIRHLYNVHVHNNNNNNNEYLNIQDKNSSVR